MSERARNVVFITVIAVMAVALSLITSTEPANVDRVEQIGARIRCPVCQGESIADSPSPMARDMMALIAERVASGNSDTEIIDELLTSYTGAVLLDPPVSGSTLWLWIAPAAALVLGVVVIIWWRRHPGVVADQTVPAASRTRARLVSGGLILVLAFAGIVVVAGNSLQERPTPAAGAADVGPEDLSEVSNATMEAVIEANADDPQINGMRLALAERYFEAGDYRSAFPHYLAVAEDPEADDGQAVTALIRLAWMAYEGNGEVETATRLLDQALAIDPGSTVARYLEARVLWCGAGELEEAVEILEGLLAEEGLDAATRAQVQSDLELARAGGECR